MTSRISPLAQVDPQAQLGSDVEIGPFCVVGPDVVLGAGCVLHSNVVIVGHTTVGERNRFFPGPEGTKWRFVCNGVRHKTPFNDGPSVGLG